MIEQVALYRDLGMIDEDWRCPARLVNQPAERCLSAPMVTNLQVTRACNLACHHCFVDVDTKPHPDELTLAQLDSLFGELTASGAAIVILAGGEPMMRRDFWDVVALLDHHDLDVALCTNAVMVNDERAERLAASAVTNFSVSLDGPDAGIHDKLRGRGAFARAVKGIRALRRANVPDLKLRVTVTAENVDHLLRFADIARDLDVPKVIFKPFRHAPAGDAKNATHLYLSRARYYEAAEAAMTAWPEDAPPATFDDGMPVNLPSWTGISSDFGCVGGTVHASVIYDGRVVACDAIHHPADWTLHERGFIESWREAPTIKSWRRLGDSGACSSCAKFSTCAGGCRSRAVAAGGTMADPDPWSHCEERNGIPEIITGGC